MIKQAIIPLAGLGSRLLPLTSIFAKELLPINGKPGIEYILDECADAGIKKIVFIISKKKQMIKDYFYKDSFYKKIIKKKKDPRVIKEYKKILKYKKMIKFVYQNKPLIIKKNCSRSMINIHNRYKSSVMASINVPKKTVSRWGIYKLGKKINKNNYVIKDVIEKPTISTAPSNKAVIGRYILPRKIFSKLLNQKPGKGGEIHITDAIQSLIKNNEKFIAHNFTGKYLDCGSMSGYIKSTLEIAKS